jgi:hypothetical protein
MKQIKTSWLTIGFAFLVLVGIAGANIVGDLVNQGWYLDEGNLRAVQGDGYVLSEVRVVDYTTTSSERTIYGWETGTVFTMSSTGDDPTTFGLPAAETGMKFTFIDNDSTAAADLIVEPASADKIDNATAGNYVSITTDDFGQLLELTAIDSTNWIITNSIGTITAE